MDYADFKCPELKLQSGKLVVVNILHASCTMLQLCASITCLDAVVRLILSVKACLPNHYILQIAAPTAVADKSLP